MTRKERTAHRRANRLCEQCCAGLQETDASFCLECTISREEARARFERTSGRGTHGPIRKLTKEQRIARNEARRADYEKRKLAGDCTHPSCKEKALDDNGRCLKHAARSRRYSLAYFHREKAAQLVATVVETPTGISPGEIPAAAKSSLVIRPAI